MTEVESRETAAGEAAARETGATTDEATADAIPTDLSCSRTVKSARTEATRARNAVSDFRVAMAGAAALLSSEGGI